MKEPQNPTPLIHNIFKLSQIQSQKRRKQQLDDKIDDPFDQLQIFQLIRHINDPQYPLTLQQLNVVCVQHIKIIKQRIVKQQQENIQSNDKVSKQKQIQKQKLLKTLQDKQLTIIQVKYTPTIPHCSMAQIIGLMIKSKLLKFVPQNYKVRVYIKQNTHQNQKQINKQINDKQRVSAAVQNMNIQRVLQKGYLGSDRFVFSQILS